jgi:hypothetical protein
MKKSTYIAPILILAAFAGLCFGQGFAPVGTSVAQFLEVGTGARATGLGQAYTGIASGAEAAFWNPAGLAETSGQNFFTSFSKWPADISLLGLSYAINLGSAGIVGVSGVYLMTDDMEITTLSQPAGTGDYFNITNFSMGLSYARFLTDRFSMGVTGKVIHEKYLTNGYTSWAVDIGTQYHTDFHGLRLGMSILHFGPEVQFSGNYIDYSDSKSYSVDKSKLFNTYSLPINFRFGAAIDLLNNDQHRLTTSMDMVHPNNNLEQYNLGLEYGFNQMFFLRGGYQIQADEGGLGLGLGVQTTMSGHLGVEFDYSYADLGILTSAHRFTLAVKY